VELLFVVESSFFLDGVGLVLAPGIQRVLEPGTPLFLVRPNGTHATATVRPLSTRASTKSVRPVAVDLGCDEAPEGTRVFAARSGTPSP